MGWPLGIGVLAVLFYFAALTKIYVGFFFDDSRYILAAQSLLQGHLVALQLPGHPALNSHYPGFALLITPFVQLYSPHWEFLKVVPFSLTILNLFLYWRITKDYLLFPYRLFAFALFALHP